MKSTFIARSFALVILIAIMPLLLHAQPAGKWYAGGKLPALSASGKVPKLVFRDSLLGYYIGVDTGYVTHDGGATWTMMQFPSNARPSPTYVFTPNHNAILSYQAYNTDSDGVVYPGLIKSNDQGATWTSIPTILPAVIKTFTMWTGKEGFRIWQDDHSTTIIAAFTHDGGITFTDTIQDATLGKYLQELGAPLNLNLKSNWSDASHGALSFYGGSTEKAYPVLVTADGGKTWTESNPSLNGNTAILHSYIYLYPGSQTIWSVPAVPKTATYFFYSTNYGTNWQTTPPFKKGELSAKTNSGVIQLAPVSPTATWAILTSDTEHFVTFENTIAYKDFSSNWVLSKNFPGVQGKNYWNVDNIQFPDPDHGFVSVQQYIDTAKSTPAIPIDTITIYRYYINPPNSVDSKVQPPALSCFPNPSSSSIKIQGLQTEEKLREIKIIGMLGMQYSLPTINSGNDIELDIRTLPAGSYFLNITTSERQEIIPIVVVH